MPNYIYLLAASPLHIGTSGRRYIPDANNTVAVVVPDDGGDIAGMVAAGYRVVDLNGPSYYRLFGTPSTSYTVASGATYRSSAIGVILCPFAANPDCVDLIAAGCALSGTV